MTFLVLYTDLLNCNIKKLRKTRCIASSAWRVFLKDISYYNIHTMYVINNVC